MYCLWFWPDIQIGEWTRRGSDFAMFQVNLEKIGKFLANRPIGD